MTTGLTSILLAAAAVLLAVSLALGSRLARAAEALREGERDHRLLFENMPLGFALHEMVFDADGRPADYRFLEVNPAFERLTGLPAAGLVGRTVLEAIPGTERSWIETYGKVVATGQPISFRNYAEALGKHFDVRAFRPRPGQFAVLFADITDLRQAEARLARLVERLNLATEAAGMGIWDWDVPRNELVWDERMYTLYGVGRGNFGGAYEAWVAGVHPDDRAAADAATQAALRGERPYDTEFRVCRPDGTVRRLRAHAVVTRDREGRPLRMTGVNFDITEHRRAEEQVRELNATLERRIAERTAELRRAGEELAGRVREIERLNRLFVGREQRMAELKERIRALEKTAEAAGS